MVDLKPVKSSHVAGFHYDEDKKVLTVGFKDGVRFAYADVPKKVADGFGNAKSPGGYLYKHIRKYNGKRVKGT